MGSVYITDYISQPDIERNELGSLLSDIASNEIEALLVWHQKINGEYLDGFPNLRGVIRYGVGYDAIDLEEIKNRGLVFCNTPDYGTDEVSDTALAMVLNILRGVSKYNYFCKSYEDTWQENTISAIRRTSEVTMGVIGAGRIGTALILKSKALKLRTVFFDPYKVSGYEKSIGADRVHDLDELIKVSDIISIHTPLTSETRGLVDSSFVNKMKTGASLVNTARGEIVKDLDVLYDALKNEKLSNVALDVLPSEPPSSCNLIDAWKKPDHILSPRITINPHTSYYSMESYREMRMKAAQNAKNIVEGKEPINIIADGRKKC